MFMSNWEKKLPPESEPSRSGIQRVIRETQRPPRTCTLCKQKKIKCNKRIPCDKCAAKGMAALCTREIVIAKGQIVNLPGPPPAVTPPSPPELQTDSRSNRSSPAVSNLPAVSAASSRFVHFENQQLRNEIAHLRHKLWLLENNAKHKPLRARLIQRADLDVAVLSAHSLWRGQVTAFGSDSYVSSTFQRRTEHDFVLWNTLNSKRLATVANAFMNGNWNDGTSWEILAPYFISKISPEFSSAAVRLAFQNVPLVPCIVDFDQFSADLDVFARQGYLQKDVHHYDRPLESFRFSALWFSVMNAGITFCPKEMCKCLPVSRKFLVNLGMVLRGSAIECLYKAQYARFVSIQTLKVYCLMSTFCHMFTSPTVSYAQLGSMIVLARTLKLDQLPEQLSGDQKISESELEAYKCIWWTLVGHDLRCFSKHPRLIHPGSFTTPVPYSFIDSRPVSALVRSGVDGKKAVVRLLCLLYEVRSCHQPVSCSDETVQCSSSINKYRRAVSGLLTKLNRLAPLLDSDQFAYVQITLQHEMVAVNIHEKSVMESEGESDWGSRYKKATLQLCSEIIDAASAPGFSERHSVDRTVIEAVSTAGIVLALEALNISRGSVENLFEPEDIPEYREEGFQDVEEMTQLPDLLCYILKAKTWIGKIRMVCIMAARCYAILSRAWNIVSQPKSNKESYWRRLVLADEVIASNFVSEGEVPLSQFSFPDTSEFYEKITEEERLEGKVVPVGPDAQVVDDFSDLYSDKEICLFLEENNWSKYAEWAAEELVRAFSVQNIP